MIKLLSVCFALMALKICGLYYFSLDATTDIAVKSAVFKLLLASLSVVLVKLFLTALDGSSEFKFKEWLNHAENMPKSVYLGARFIGVCLLVGLIIS